MALSIRCEACAAEFSLDEELFERRVAGRLVRFKCSACEQLSSIDAISGTRQVPLEPDADVKGELSEQDFAAAEEEIAEILDEEVASLPPSSLPKIGRPPPRPRLESKVDDELWVVNVKEGAEDQEIFESSLVDQIAAGKIPSDAIVWKEGMTDWLALANVAELAKYLPRPVPRAAYDKTGGLFGTGMEASFGSNSGERKSAPPPLPPKKRSYGSANKKSHGQQRGGSKPVALSPGFLFSVDDARSEPPEALPEPSPKGPKAAPKPPLRAMRRAVTRDLDFSDIEGEEMPLSGTPALKDLTTIAKKNVRTQAAAGGSLASLGAVEEEVLGPPSIDISGIGGGGIGGAEEPTRSRDQQAERVDSTPPPSSRPSAAPSSTTGKRKRKRKKGRASKRPSARPEAQAAGTAPALKRESHRAKAAASERALQRDSEARAGWFTPGRALVLVGLAGLAYFLFSRQLQAPDTESAAKEPEIAEPIAQEQAAATEKPAKRQEEPASNTPQQVEAAPEAAEKSAAVKPTPQAPANAPAVPQPAAGVVKPELEKKAEPAPAPAPEPQPKAEAKKAAPPPSNADAPPFNKAAAVGALNAAVGQASGCRQPGDPSGTARVVITFAPSGRVTSANLSGPPFAGTRTGGCIASTMRRAKVPPFSGDHVTVSKSVVIR